jgi:hypothetical protein
MFVKRSVFLFLFFSFSCVQPQDDEKHRIVLFRSIGHRLLLASGDSTSRILPIQKTNPATYQIRFENSFEIMPDSLANITIDNLKSTNPQNQYRVSVFTCQKNEMVYGFEWSPKSTKDLTCLGRGLPENCYIVEIEVLTKGVNPNILWGALVASIILLLFFVVFFIKNERNVVVSTEKVGAFQKVGAFKYFQQTGILILEVQKTRQKLSIDSLNLVINSIDIVPEDLKNHNSIRADFNFVLKILSIESKDEKAKLIICDDDNILDGPFADELLRNHSEDEFLGYSGIKIIKRFLKRNSYQFIENNNSDKLEVDILQGYAGFIFDRLMISDNFLEFYDNLAYQFKSNPSSFTKALFLNDDVTLSLYMKSKMFVTHQFGNEFFNTGHIKSLSQSKIDALHQNNIFVNHLDMCYSFY